MIGKEKMTAGCSRTSFILQDILVYLISVSAIGASKMDVDNLLAHILLVTRGSVAMYCCNNFSDRCHDKVLLLKKRGFTLSSKHSGSETTSPYSSVLSQDHTA